MLRAGLDGAEGTVSLESVATPGSFLSAAPQKEAACADDPQLQCDLGGKAGLCISQPDVYKVHCRFTCGTCGSLATALGVRRVSGSEAAVASFRMAQPLTPQYPPGSKVVTGANRRYLVAPLGHLVDERYTVYFNISQPPA